MKTNQRIGYLITRIRDTGDGIKRSTMRDLFSTFKRTQKEFGIEGIGIGFSNARKLCSAMGGNIFVIRY